MRNHTPKKPTVEEVAFLKSYHLSRKRGRTACGVDAVAVFSLSRGWFLMRQRGDVPVPAWGGLLPFAEDVDSIPDAFCQALTCSVGLAPRPASVWMPLARR